MRPSDTIRIATLLLFCGTVAVSDPSVGADPVLAEAEIVEGDALISQAAVNAPAAPDLGRALSGNIRQGAVAEFAEAAGSGIALTVDMAPRRVVSMNLCTDQMALLLAAPGQLVSVSHLAADPRSSTMVDAARALTLNRGHAEEIVRHKPDLILAGSWTARAAKDMLTRLGYRVETFAPATSLVEARGNLLRMGALLGRDAEARRLVAAFDARLATLTRATGKDAPRAALYAAQGYTAGPQSLPGDILRTAGLRNIATEFGLPAGGRVPIESLLLADPDVVLVGARWPGHSRATALVRHPALNRALPMIEIGDGPDWTCETPALLDAVAAMVALRDSLVSGTPLR